MNINDDVLDVIEDHVYELDTKGVYRFAINVIIDCLKSRKHSEFSYNIRDTLQAFLLEMFNNDKKSITDCFLMGGLGKWNGLDDYNRFKASTNNSYLNRSIMWFLPLDLDYLWSRSDYIIDRGNLWEYDEDLTISKPIINCHAYADQIEESLWDKLYIAVLDSTNGSNTGESHFAWKSCDQQQFAYGGNTPICYDTLKNVQKRFGDSFTGYRELFTVLPKEILEKYNLPIYDGVE